MVVMRMRYKYPAQPIDAKLADNPIGDFRICREL